MQKWPLWMQTVIRIFASLKLAVFLILTLAAVIAVATVIEADYGRAMAQWYIYHNRWFAVLLALLGINIFTAAAVRFPWKRHQTGFVVTHCGLLVLLAGSVQTFVGSIEGQVALQEGETKTTMTILERSQVRAWWVNQPQEGDYRFSFEPGPKTWHDGVTLDMGRVDDLSARVQHYYAQAEFEETFVADETKMGGPAVKIRLQGPMEASRMEHQLIDEGFGDEAQFGPLRVQLRQSRSEAMLAEFLKPKELTLPDKGVLLAFHDNHVEQIPVAENIGKTVALDDQGGSVEIVAYHANARSDVAGQFTSAGNEPKNPLLDLRVRPSKTNKTMRQIAFAKNPLMTLDGIHNEICPVVFEYRHPAAKVTDGLEFMQASDGQLYARTVMRDKVQVLGAVKTDTPLPYGQSFAITVIDYLPHARINARFIPVSVPASQKEKPEAAAEVSITVDGQTQTLWLQRNNPQGRTIVTPKGLLQVALGYADAPLGFGLKLLKFNREVNPGGVGNASFASTVRLQDPHQGIDEERVISMNEPLTYQHITFYQSSFQEAEQGPPVSVFSVAHDPGRWLKYAGCLMICFGIAIMFYMRAYFFKRKHAVD
jgi:hypothetical protein